MLLRADSAASSVSLDEFCRRPHVAVSALGKVTDDVDRALASYNRQRRVVPAVPQFSALPALLVDSDMPECSLVLAVARMERLSG